MGVLDFLQELKDLSDDEAVAAYEETPEYAVAEYEGVEDLGITHDDD